MPALLVQLLPVFVWFGIGLLLRRRGLATQSDGEFLLRLVFFVTLPALILASLPQAELGWDKAALPLTNVGVALICMAASLLFARARGLERRQTGTLLVSTMILNNSFMFPFILAAYGTEGFADAILFDLGNALFMATAVYALAFHYGGERHGRWTMLLRILRSPLIWALALGIALALSDNALPAPLLAIVQPLGNMTAPLILIALGLYFSLQLSDLRLVGWTVSLRMGVGFLAGLALASALGLEGQSLVVASLCAGAPIGFNALTFSSMAKLDTQLCSSAVSLSILAGLIYVPLLILLFAQLGF